MVLSCSMRISIWIRTEGRFIDHNNTGVSFHFGLQIA